MGTTWRLVAVSSVVMRARSSVEMTSPSASSTARFCLPTYTWRIHTPGKAGVSVEGAGIRGWG